MNIISYRGPGMAGGVSSALALLWRQQDLKSATWWHLSGADLQATDDIDEQPRHLSAISRAVLDGHYRYCNEFLWPVMHDLPQFANYRADDHKLYITANRIITRNVLADRSANHDHPVFVQDYQMAIVPELLERSGVKSLVFWHIPWPENVAPQHVRQLSQIAKGLVSAEVLGFHTMEYAQNFLNFVQQNVPGVHVDFEAATVTRGVAQQDALPWTTGRHGAVAGRTTAVITAPLGIDPTFWKSSALIPQIRLHGSEFAWLHGDIPYVLSVDRADYTKGVVERFRAIDKFFEMKPEMKEKVHFVQICGRTRPGLPAFDQYWNQCKFEATALENRWKTDSWSPLIWVEKPCTGAELSVIYRDAAVMLVNPVRDGLNLTAKEFVASQIRRPGALALSGGAGAWHELGDEAIRLHPENSAQMAHAIEFGLNMNTRERLRRIAIMNGKLARNTLNDWWGQISARIPSGVANSGSSMLSAVTS